MMRLLAVAIVTLIAQTSMQVPRYQVDPAWPKQLPNHWLVGAVVGVAVDANDHVWITHRPSTLQPNETRSFWKAAPPVLEFDQAGNLVSSWGGPGAGYEWPQLEHGIYIDHQDNVWLGGGGDKDAQILKFTRQGKFLLQIGHQGKNGGSNDTQNLGGTANMVVDAAANELYVADGYVNHRVIVFDADDRRLQAPLGRVRQEAGRLVFSRPPASGCRARSAARCSTRTARASTIRTGRRRRSSGSSTPCGSRTTASSTSAIAPTIGSRCSGRTGPSCRRRSSPRRPSAAARCGTSASQPTRRRPS